MTAIRTFVLAVVLGLAVPAAAQQPVPAFPAEPPTAEDVIAAYAALIDRGRDRVVFGLPERVTWRVPGPPTSEGNRPAPSTPSPFRTWRWTPTRRPTCPETP